MIEDKDVAPFFESHPTLPTLTREAAREREQEAYDIDQRTLSDKFDIIHGSVQSNLELHTPVFGAAYKINNALKTNWELLNNIDIIDPLSPEYIDKADADHIDPYLSARTDGEWNRINNRIKYEKSLEEREGSIIGAGISLIGILPTDLGAYIPISSVLRASSIAQGLGKGFIKGLPGAFVGGAVSEGLQLATLETRTEEEALFNLGVQTIVGAALGGALGGRAAVKASEKAVYDYMAEDQLKGNVVRTVINAEGKPIRLDTYSVGNDGSVGAARVRSMDLTGHNTDRLVGGNEETSNWHLGKPFIWMTGKLTQSPIIKALQSPSQATARYGNEMLTHSLDTEGTLAGKNLPASMQQQMIKYDTSAIHANRAFRASYFEYLGLDPNATITNEIRHKLNNLPAGTLSEQEYSMQMLIASVTKDYKGSSYIKSKARAIYEEHLEPIYEALKADGVLGPNPPSGADWWLGRIPNRLGMTNNRLATEGFFEYHFGLTNDKVKLERAKLENLEDDRRFVLDNLGLPKDSPEYIKANKAVAAEKKRINTKILKGDYTDDMLIGERGHSYDEIKQLKALHKPIRAVKTKIRDLEQRFSVETKAANPNRLPGQKNAAPNESQTAIKLEIEELKGELKALREDINFKAVNKELPESFTYFNEKQQTHYLKKTNKGTRELRQVLNARELTESAQATINNMLGTGAKDIADDLVGAARSGSSGITNVGKRVLMIDDKFLYEGGILIGDFNQVMRSAIKQSGQLLEWNRYFKAKGWDGKGTHLEFLAKDITADYQRLHDAARIKYKDDVAGLNKEEARLQRAKESDIANISDIYTRATHSYEKNLKKIIQASDALNKYSYATQLGNLVLTMAGETVAGAYRQGIKGYITDSVVPGILNAMTGKGKLFKKQAADIGLGMEVEQALWMQNLGIDVEGELPMNGVQRFFGKASQGMSLLNFSAPVSDMLQRINVTGSVSGFLRQLGKLEKGTISKNNLADLALHGLTDPNDVKQILAAYNKYGAKHGGGYLANWQNWVESAEEIRAAQVLQDAVHKKVRSVLFSGPAAAHFPSGIDPQGATRSLSIYMGWGLSANANYFLPLVQRLDARKAAGAAAMIGMSMFTDPLRKLSNGEEPNLDPGFLFAQGVLNSGTLGIFINGLSKLNAVGGFIPSAIQDKDKGKGLSIAIGGSGLALVENTLRLASELLTGELNTSDLKRQARQLPFIGALPLRPFVAAGIENLDLPETRAKAKRANE